MKSWHENRFCVLVAFCEEIDRSPVVFLSQSASKANLEVLFVACQSKLLFMQQSAGDWGPHCRFMM